MKPTTRRLRPLALTLLTVLSAAAIRADEWAPNVTALGTWHSNATLANRGVDELDSLQLSADVLASQRYPVTRNDALHLTGHFAGEWWPRYTGLTRGVAGARAEWRHQFGSHKRAPVVGIEGLVDAVEAKETARRGYVMGGRASLRQSFDDRTRALAWHEVSWMDARSGTFDSGSSETALELQRDLTPLMRVTLTGRFRDGDIVSYASGVRPDLESVATARREVRTFDRDMTAYRIDTKTWSGRLALFRALDDTTAIVLSYELRSSERGAFRATDHLLAVGFVHQF